MKRPSLRRIVHVVGLLILIASLVPFVLYAVPETAGADHSYVVMSESMTPAIPLGSIVLVEEKATPAAYEEGDVITFEKGGESIPTTHRIISVQETDQGRSFVTKGDANEDPDAEPVPQQRVIGSVMSVGGHLFVIPYAGHVVLFVNSQYGFYTLVALPLVLLLADTVWRFATASRESETGSESTSGGTAAAGAQATTVPASAADDAATGESSSSNTFTVTPTDLRMTFVVLMAFTAYSAWTVSRALTAVTAAVTVGTAVTTLSVLGILVATTARSGGGASDGGTETERPPSEPSGDTFPPVPDAADGSDGLDSHPEELMGEDSDESVTSDVREGPTAISGVDEDDD